MITRQAMARRSRNQHERLIEQAQQYNLDNALSGARQPRLNTRMEEILNVIWNHWVPIAEATRKLSATDFSYLYDSYSPPTIVKAKRMLGIKSTRVDGFWYWSRPRKNPEQAVNQQYIQRVNEGDVASRVLRLMSSARCKFLKTLMEQHNFYITNSFGYNEMDMNGWGKVAARRAKAALNISTVKVGTQSMWVWYSDEVTRWLEGFLASGPVPVEAVYSAGMDMNWHPQVVRMAREALGTIRLITVRHKLCWVNTSEPVAPEAPDDRVPLDITTTPAGHQLRQYLPEESQPHSDEPTLAPVVEMPHRYVDVDFTPGDDNE